MLIVDRDGAIVHATIPSDEAARLAGPTLQLLSRARDVVDLGESDELQMLCVRTRKHEMLFCSEADAAFAICVIQDTAPVDGAPSLVFSKAARSVLRAGVGEVF